MVQHSFTYQVALSVFLFQILKSAWFEKQHNCFQIIFLNKI